MPEVATHFAAQTLLTRRASALPHALLGVLLPDLLTRGPNIVWPWLGKQLVILHMPAGLIVLTFLLALLYAPGQRAHFAGWFGFGAICHLALDALQINTAGAYYWLWPFSMNTDQLSLFWPEDTVMTLPLLLAVAGLDLWRRNRRAREQTCPAEPERDPGSP